MPHSIIEHSFFISKPQIDNLLLLVNKKISSCEGNFDIDQCKARAIWYENFVIADGLKSQDFMHLTIKIMAGRSLEIREKLAETLLSLLENFLKKEQLSNNQIALSVDIVEMNKDAYKKILI